MKKILLLVVLIAPALISYGQKHKKDKKAEVVLPPPRVWIANIPSYNTTHDMLVANTMLITDSIGCKVSGFTISLSAPGQPFYGPLYVNGNEESETQKGTIKKWADYPQVTVHIQDIHLNCHETDATSPALEYTYNFDK